MDGAMGATRYTRSVGIGGLLHDLRGANHSTSGLWVQSQAGQSIAFSGIDFGRTNVVSVSASRGLMLVRQLRQMSDTMACFFLDEGEVVFEDGSGNLAVGSPDSFVTCSDPRELRLTWNTSGRMVALIMPNQVVRDFGLAPVPGFAPYTQVSALRRPAAAFLGSLVVDTGPISSVAAYFVEKLIHEMVGGLLLENHGVGRSGHRQSLYHQAMALISASAGDPGLTPESLARKLNVSLRHLQRDFQKRNESVADRLRQARVDLAIRLLTDSTMGVLSLDQIAAHAGFASLGHLRRTLRSAGLGTPREIRAVGRYSPVSLPA